MATPKGTDQVKIPRVSTNKEGFVNQLLSRSNRDGTSTWNLENLIMNLAHWAGAGVGGVLIGRELKKSGKLSSLPSLTGVN